MQRLRTLRQKARYTQLANDAIDRLPSLEAVGLLATILRHDDAFEFDMALLIKRKPRLGKDKAYRARAELIEHGYLVQVRFQHSYRGQFWTDVYRAAEPHTSDDLQELRRRYTPGQRVVITDDQGRDHVARVTWAEMRSASGMEVLPAEFGSSAPSSAPSSAKPQVGPTSGYPEVGQPEVGNPEPLKEDCGEDEQKTSPQPPAPSPQTTPFAGRDEGDETSVETDVSSEVWTMLRGIPVPAGKRPPGRRSRKLAEVAQRCQRIVSCPERYCLTLADLHAHLAADLHTVRHSIVGCWLYRLADNELPDPRPRTVPTAPRAACGLCGARAGEPAAVRTVEDPNTGRTSRCVCVRPSTVAPAEV